MAIVWCLSIFLLKLHSGGHSYFRLDIILVKGLSKCILNTYFSGMKIDLKYAFLHAFFVICVSCPFQNLSIWPKTYLFFPNFTPLNDIRMYIAWSWKNNPNYVNSYFTGMISNFKYKWPPGTALRWIPQPKTFTSDFTQWPQKKMVRSCYSLIACKANYLWCLELFWTLSVFYIPYCS